jgi:hypothetical protein
VGGGQFQLTRPTHPFRFDREGQSINPQSMEILLESEGSGEHGLAQCAAD